MAALPDNATHLSGDTYVVTGLTNAGFVSGLAIDTCEDESRYFGAAIDTLAITHGHADHFSAAHAIRTAGARVLAARDDAALIENPDINIRGMFSWAKPSDEMTTKLFRGIPCHVDGYLEDFADVRAEAVPLPGHTLGHTGFLTVDRVLFTGDAVYLSELWERHPLPYSIDPGMVKASLERVRALDFDWLVPAHGRPVSREEAQGHLEFHLGQIRTIEALLLEGLREGLTTEQAVAFLSSRRGLAENAASYWLAVTTVKGYLSELLGRGEIEFFVRDHAGWWKAVE